MLSETMRTQDDATDNVLEGLLARSSELLRLVDAEGVAVVEGTGNPVTAGRTPPLALIQEIAKWLEDRTSPFSTASLSTQCPAAAAAKDVASGLLTFALPGQPLRRLLWFRPEIIRTVTWGGDPAKPVERDDSMRLQPRSSFAAWKQEVRLQSHPWTDGDLAAAEDLRRYALEIDLERQVLRASRAVFARDEILAIVSHDLRNPLGVVQMDAAALKTWEVPGDEDISSLRASADRILRSVGLMSRLIADLLDMAKIDAGRLDLQKQPEPSRALVEGALSILEPLASAKQITIEKDLTEAPPVNADRDRIFYVLSNIIGNAIKFTPERGTITLRTESRRGELLISVDDTGPGIPSEELAHVFDRYRHGHASHEGTGLGLYIAKGIVLAHGGSIWAEAAAGGGSRFCVTLPLAASA
jgi:light-regulated signal transduction histidine kinase (bacteriophytochrome)